MGTLIDNLTGKATGQLAKQITQAREEGIRDGIRTGANKLTATDILDNLLAEKKQLILRVSYLERLIRDKSLCFSCGSKLLAHVCQNQRCAKYKESAKDNSPEPTAA